MSLNRKYGWLSKIALVAVLHLLIGFTVVSSMRYSVHRNRTAMETELKSNLHDIQLAVERYAVDHGGSYPSYLIGGAPGTAGADMAADVLLREGYLEHYPRNPFAEKQYGEMDVLTIQQRLAFSSRGADPLTPGSVEGDKYGYRFGENGSLMGQVLCDARWPTWLRVDPATGELTEHATWADVEYRFWDMWSQDPPLPFSPGQFFYKGIGPVVSINKDFDPEQRKSILPTETDQYLLGAYGGLNDKGKDIIGDEPEYTWFADDQTEMLYWMRTSSELDPVGTAGSPFGIHDLNEVCYGNPNGIRDGIILVLTAGEDFIGDR